MTAFTHRFVEFIPEKLEEKTLYVSVAYGTVSHRCACGCGREVVTPLAPTDWKLTFDGETISLHPSIGNWNFPCRAHYWIKSNRVLWAEDWSKYQVDREFVEDRAAKDRYYNPDDHRSKEPVAEVKPKRRFWQSIRPSWWRK